MESRPANTAECVTAARQTAALLVTQTQQALASADPVLCLLLLPLIKQAAKLEESLSNIRLALESKE